jgi:hypothetical protein
MTNWEYRVYARGDRVLSIVLQGTVEEMSRSTRYEVLATLGLIATWGVIGTITRSWLYGVFLAVWGLVLGTTIFLVRALWRKQHHVD